MKNILLILAVCISLAFNVTGAAAEIELSDAELDEISAEGFDINVEAVLAFQNMAAIDQVNAALIAGLANGPSNIYNMNSASASNSSGSSYIRQENIACVFAREGDIDGAEINNTNSAATYSTGPLNSNQKNTAILIALGGGISNSKIDNLNDLNVQGSGFFPTINQQNIAILISAGTVGAQINNVNQYSVSGAAVVNSGNQITQSFTFGGLSGIINIDNVQ